MKVWIDAFFSQECKINTRKNQYLLLKFDELLKNVFINFHATVVCMKSDQLRVYTLVNKMFCALDANARIVFICGNHSRFYIMHVCRCAGNSTYLLMLVILFECARAFFYILCPYTSERHVWMIIEMSAWFIQCSLKCTNLSPFRRSETNPKFVAWNIDYITERQTIALIHLIRQPPSLSHEYARSFD